MYPKACALETLSEAKHVFWELQLLKVQFNSLLLRLHENKSTLVSQSKEIRTRNNELINSKHELEKKIEKVGFLQRKIFASLAVGRPSLGHLSESNSNKI